MEIITTLMQLGSRCFLIIHPAFAPVAWEASTYSCSRRERICPRISRAMDTQYSRPNTKNRAIMLEPIFANTVPSMAGPRVCFMTVASRITISISGRA